MSGQHEPGYHYYPTSDPDKTRKYSRKTRRNSTLTTRLAKLNGKLITAYKKCLHWKKDLGGYSSHQVLVELQIASRTRRMQPRNHKCRAARAKVVAIYELESGKRTGKQFKRAVSAHDLSFHYRVGAVVEPKGERYNHKRIEECEAGIHFFLTEKEALEYTI